MKRSAVVVFALSALAIGTASVPAASEDHSADVNVHAPRTIAFFDVMYGVDGPFLEEENAIRGVPGDELPWEIRGFARGRLDTDGHLSIRIRGLVFTHDEVVPPNLRGTNDETEFRGLVSCLSETDEETVETVNVVTDPFPATPGGNSSIVTTIDLPESCIAPIIMVLAGSEDKWFAVTGFEAEEEEEE
jgi:hypothetical protein